MAKAKGIGRAKKGADEATASPPPDRVDTDRERMIAEAAYFRAQARGFQGGDPIDDWLAAEAEIDRNFPAGKRQ